MYYERKLLTKLRQLSVEISLKKQLNKKNLVQVNVFQVNLKHLIDSISIVIGPGGVNRKKIQVRRWTRIFGPKFFHPKFGHVMHRVFSSNVILAIRHQLQN